MVAFSREGRKFFEDLELNGENAVSHRRGLSIVVSEPDPNNWMRKLFEKIHHDHPEAEKSVLYRVFKREVEFRIGREADVRLEERLWSIVERVCAAA